MPAIIPAEFQWNPSNNSSRIPAGIPAEYQQNAGNNSGGIRAGISVEYRRNAGNNSGGIPAGIPVEYWQNAGNNPAEFRLEMSGIPGEYRRNAGNNSGGFQRNSGGIRPASTWNSGKVRTGIPAGFHRNSGSVFTRVNSVPDRPLSAFFQMPFQISASEIFETLASDGFKPEHIKCLQRKPTGEVLITLKTKQICDNF